MSIELKLSADIFPGGVEASGRCKSVQIYQELLIGELRLRVSPMIRSGGWRGVGIRDPP